MKKILGISLCALFAVSAANAEIASTEWVSQQVGAIDTSGITTNANNISALAERVTENENDIATNTNAITTNTSAILQNATKTNTNTTNIATNTQAIADINADIADMTANVTGSHFIQGVSQANGKVTPTGKNFETTLSASTDDNAPTSKAVADYVAGQVSDLEVGALEERVDTNETNIQTNKTNITNLTSRVGTNETSIGTLNSSMTTLSGKVDINTNNIATNENKISEHTEAIQGMDLTATTKHYVKIVSQENGKVSATDADFADTVDATIQNNAPTSAAVATYVDQKVNGLGLGSLARKSAVTNAEITDGTIANADISDGAAIATSKIAFSADQTAALDSNITSSKVAQIDTNAQTISQIGAQVTTNEGSITNLTSGLATANEKIENNIAAINDNTTTISSHTNMLGLLLYGPGNEECARSAEGCTLVYSSTGYKWEKITRAAQ